MAIRFQMMGANIMPLAAEAINGTRTTNITALGNSQLTALQLSDAINTVTTTPASTGAMVFSFPANYSAGDTMLLTNLGANGLSVYPPVGARINILSANAALVLSSGKTALFYFLDSTQIVGILSA